MAGCGSKFWSKVNKHGPTLVKRLGPCWLWTGATDKDGYGQSFFMGIQHKAHRVAWFLETGEWPIPQGCHKCDNPSCVRFSHIFQGTPKNNTDDMVAKGRASFLRGAWKTHCKHGHQRTSENVNEHNACILCVQARRMTLVYRESAKQRSRKWRESNGNRLRKRR
jgi:hypothetical protein